MSGSTSQIRITLTGQEALIARLTRAPESLINILYDRLKPFAQDVRSTAQQLAVGKTGRLASSIQAQVIATSRTVAIVLFTEGVPYAAIQESGGQIAARIISVAKGSAMAFIWGKGGARLGDVSFYSTIRWPGARIPPKHYILNALKNRRAEFDQICRQAMEQSLTQGAD